MNEELTCPQKLLRFIPMVALPLIVGAISALLTGNAMDSYQVMNQPPLAPPAWLFPIAWTILYILMGLISNITFSKMIISGNSGKKYN